VGPSVWTNGHAHEHGVWTKDHVHEEGR